MTLLSNSDVAKQSFENLMQVLYFQTFCLVGAKKSSMFVGLLSDYSLHQHDFHEDADPTFCQ